MSLEQFRVVKTSESLVRSNSIDGCHKNQQNIFLVLIFRMHKTLMDIKEKELDLFRIMFGINQLI